MNVDREDHQVQISGKATGEDGDDPRAGEADGGGERRKHCLLVLPYCPCKGCGESPEGCLTPLGHESEWKLNQLAFRFPVNNVFFYKGR